MEWFRREHVSSEGLGRAKEVMLGGSGVVPRSTQSPHVRAVHQVALGNAKVRGSSAVCADWEAQPGSTRVPWRRAAPGRAVFRPHPHV